MKIQELACRVGKIGIALQKQCNACKTLHCFSTFVARLLFQSNKNKICNEDNSQSYTDKKTNTVTYDSDHGCTSLCMCTSQELKNWWKAWFSFTSSNFDLVHQNSLTDFGLFHSLWVNQVGYDDNEEKTWSNLFKGLLFHLKCFMQITGVQSLRNSENK